MINILDDNTALAAESTDTSTVEVDQPVDQADSSVPEPVQDTDNSVSESGEEDSFFDPNTVPEELKPAYKQMQSAFTKKTQEIAEARKEAEAIRQKAEAYDRYSQYVPVIDEMLAKKESQTETPQMQALAQRLREAGYDDDTINVMKLGADFVLGQFKQTQESERIGSQIEKASTIDERLNDKTLTYDIDGETQTFGQIVEDLVVASPNWMEDPVSATQKAIKKVDALIGKAKIDGKQELSAKAKNQAAKFPQVNSSPQGAVDKSAPMTIKDAYAQAKAEIGE